MCTCVWREGEKQKRCTTIRTLVFMSPTICTAEEERSVFAHVESALPNAGNTATEDERDAASLSRPHTPGGRRETLQDTSDTVVPASTSRYLNHHSCYEIWQNKHMGSSVASGLLACLTLSVEQKSSKTYS